MSLPSTDCDYVLDRPIHFSESATLETGNNAFSYGSDNNSFVSQNEEKIVFDVKILFEAKTDTATIKLSALDAGCSYVPGFGFPFHNLNSNDSNVITYDRLNDSVELNGRTLYHFAGGSSLVKYIWVDVTEDYLIPGAKSSYSYLVDVDNLQNPTGTIDEGEEPSGKRPVLIIPGIAGSELYQDDNLVWANISKMFSDVGDDFLRESLEMGYDGNTINDITSDKIISEINIKIPSLGTERIIQDIFKSLIIELENNSYVNSDTYFLFPYDWRLDLEQSTDLLNTRIEEIKTLTGFNKIDIIAHSMGGLVAENYIYENGKDSINKLIFVGTPHLGAPKAAKILLKGDNMGIPWLTQEVIKDLSLNFPSIYTLLPSRKYFEEFQGYIAPYSFLGTNILNYDNTSNWLKNENLNDLLINNSESFSNKNLYNQDFSGIEVFNITGCKTSTQAAYKYSIGNLGIGSILYTSGDGTVPQISSETINIPSNQKYYVKDAKHAELPSTQGVKELISGILSNNINVADNISNSSSFCDFKGKQLTWRSPVEVHVYDDLGNHSGPIEGGIENNIAGVDYEIINGEKFVFVPTDNGRQYEIVGIGEDEGTFDLLISNIDNGDLISTTVFNDVPVSTETNINFNIDEVSQDDMINYNFDGVGEPELLTTNSTLDANQSNDLNPPQTEIDLTGIEGTNGWYKGNVNITLNASDDNSGLLSTRFSIDGGITFNDYSSPIDFTVDGVFNIQYYSVDKAGNNEEIHELEIKIDKTAPEFFATYDFGINDFVVFGKDNLDSNPEIICSNTDCNISDAAGNTTKIIFNKVLNKPRLFEVYSIQYNEIAPSLLVKNIFRISDNTQEINIDGQEKATIDYSLSKNISTINTQIGKIKSKETMSGLKLLQLVSNQGNINIRIK